MQGPMFCGPCRYIGRQGQAKRKQDLERRVVGALPLIMARASRAGTSAYPICICVHIYIYTRTRKVSRKDVSHR